MPYAQTHSMWYRDLLRNVTVLLPYTYLSIILEDSRQRSRYILPKRSYRIACNLRA